MVTQFYLSEAENEYVIKGNAAVMKCKIPSFVADFVQVEAWIDAEDGTVLTAPNANDSSASYGYFSFYFSHSRFFLSVTATICFISKVNTTNVNVSSLSPCGTIHHIILTRCIATSLCFLCVCA